MPGLDSYTNILGLKKPKTDYVNTLASETMAETAQEQWNARNTVPGAEMISQAPAVATPTAQTATPTEQQSVATKTVQTEPGKQSAGGQQRPQSYADLFVALNPYRPATPEQLEEERKRNKRNALFAAISDGISALSNLYFTTKGAPNSFNGGSTLSGKMYERQRQLQKDREARDKEYLNGYLRALEMDRAQGIQERNWQHQLQREMITDKRYDDEKAENRRRWDQQQADTKAQREQQQKNWDKQFEANEQQRKASNALAWANHNLNKQYKTESNRIKELTAKVKNAGEETFSDGDNNTVKINKLVWDGSMDGVYEQILLNEWQNSGSRVPFESFREVKDKMYNTPQKKAGYVKGNWNKYDETKKTMYNLSQIDPMDVVSHIDAEETDNRYYGGTVIGNTKSNANDGNVDDSQFLRK